MHIKCGFVFIHNKRKYRNKITTNMLHIVRNRHAYRYMVIYAEKSEA